MFARSATSAGQLYSCFIRLSATSSLNSLGNNRHDCRGNRIEGCLNACPTSRRTMQARSHDYLTQCGGNEWAEKNGNITWKTIQALCSRKGFVTQEVKILLRRYLGPRVYIVQVEVQSTLGSTSKVFTCNDRHRGQMSLAARNADNWWSKY